MQGKLPPDETDDGAAAILPADIAGGLRALHGGMRSAGFTVQTPKHSFSVGGRGQELTAMVTLYPQEGGPIVRALVVDRTTRGTQVHFEAAADGTLLVRLTDA